MGLSRKHKKDLKRLRKSAEAVWAEQQEVLSHAATVLTESKRQASKLAQSEVAPRVKDAYEHRVRPAYEGGVSFVEGSVSSARDTVLHKVVPSVAAVIGTAASVFEAAKDAKTRGKLAEISKSRWEELTAPIVPQKKKSGIGTFFVVSAAVVAVAGVGYAVWQTFRADDELWVAEDEAATPGTDASAA